MWIDGDPVLHIIDLGTKYSVAKFMKNESAEHIWEILQNFWFTAFMGYPRVIAHNQGPQFTADNFQISSSPIAIVTKERLTESHNSLSLCERCHSIVRRVSNKLKNEEKNQEKTHYYRWPFTPSTILQVR